MKKIFVAVVLSVLFVANTALAMTFSQPVKVGEFGWSLVRGGFVVKGATENNGNFFTSNYRKNNTETYGKGTARFGDSLYIHYNSYRKKSTWASLGAKDASNTIEFNFENEVLCRIYKISTNSELGNFYLINGGGMSILEDFWFILLGQKNDGMWVKYFDTEDIHKRYFAQRFGCWFNDFKIHDNAISIQYRRIFNGQQIGRDYADEYGEFRFTWDDAAQWFGVEQIVY